MDSQFIFWIIIVLIAGYAVSAAIIAIFQVIKNIIMIIIKVVIIFTIFMLLFYVSTDNNSGDRELPTNTGTKSIRTLKQPNPIDLYAPRIIHWNGKKYLMTPTVRYDPSTLPEETITITKDHIEYYLTPIHQ